MHENVLQIKQLFYKNIGGEPYYLRNFFDTIEYLDEPFSEITLRVIRLVLGDRQACDGIMGKDSHVEAKVQIGSTEYDVHVKYMVDSCSPGFYAQTVKDTMEYSSAVMRTKEEQTLSCFEGFGTYPERLYQYLNPEERYSGDLWNATDGISTTKTFQRFLRRFIQEFKPVRLLPGKDYWLHLESDGRFTVRLGINGEEIPCLSETENWVYHYLCYLHLLRFWNEMRKRCRFPVLISPILIRDFSDRLDENVNFNTLLEQACEISDQVIVA